MELQHLIFDPICPRFRRKFLRMSNQERGQCLQRTSKADLASKIKRFAFFFFYFLSSCCLFVCFVVGILYVCLFVSVIIT